MQEYIIMLESSYGAYIKLRNKDHSHVFKFKDIDHCRAYLYPMMGNYREFGNKKNGEFATVFYAHIYDKNGNPVGEVGTTSVHGFCDCIWYEPQRSRKRYRLSKSGKTGSEL